jgi:arsenite-transporting ATPase
MTGDVLTAHRSIPAVTGEDGIAVKWYDRPTRYMFFTGKGGVGKTSLACATAIHMADMGKQILLVSTDPASNLGQVFGTNIGDHDPTPIAGVPNLWVLDIDPEAAAKAYRDRLVGPARGVLPEPAVRQMEEQLSGACTTEIAAFDEFTALLTDESKTGRFDHIIFDTAPTGHTLRLLKLPSAWSNFLNTSQSDSSCLGPLAGLDKQRRQYTAVIDAFGDGARTTVVLVSRPQVSALNEAGCTKGELSALGLTNQRHIINGLMPDITSDDPLAEALVKREQEALAHLPDVLRELPTDRVPLKPMDMVGIEALRELLAPSSSNPQHGEEPLEPVQTLAKSFGQLVDEIAADGHGLVMVMGKGGVGKTTIAAAVAVELAARGHEVHLTTTDPAAHIAVTVDANVEHLQVSRIDPRVETERYRQHVLETKGKDLDEQGRALLEEDLRSPCTEEIAVFQAFSRAISESRRKFVVVDTAPTGHTLLLLDATGAYHHEIMRHAKEGMNLVTPLMRLQDPKQTKILIVTLAETTPVLEAAALQADLRRAGIEPWAWVINSSLAVRNPRDPLLAARAQSERPQIKKVRNELAQRVALVPWLSAEPIGTGHLRELVRELAGAAAV